MAVSADAPAWSSPPGGRVPASRPQPVVALGTSRRQQDKVLIVDEPQRYPKKHQGQPELDLFGGTA